MISHVEAVGRQQQPAIQPCTNSTVNFLGNRRGEIREAPVIHLMRSIKLTPSMPEVKKKKITAQESMHTTSNSTCNKAGINKLELHIRVFMAGWKTNQSPIPYIAPDGRISHHIHVSKSRGRTTFSVGS